MFKVLFLAVAWLVASACYADEGICQSMAAVAHDAAVVRDEGVSREGWLGLVRPAVVEQTDQDARLYAASVAALISATVWKFPYQSPGEEGNLIFRECMKRGW